MYAALWRRLPGPRPVKATLSLILVVAVIALCFLWLFPTLAPLMPFNDNSVQTGLSRTGPSPVAVNPVPPRATASP